MHHSVTATLGEKAAGREMGGIRLCKLNSIIRQGLVKAAFEQRQQFS